MATTKSTSTTRRTSSSRASKQDPESQVSPARWGGVALVIMAIVAAVILAMVSPSEPSRAPAAAAAEPSPSPVATDLAGQAPTVQPRITYPIDGKTTAEIDFPAEVELPLEEGVPRRLLTLYIMSGGKIVGELSEPKTGGKVTVKSVRVEPGQHELTAVLGVPGAFGPPSEPVLLTVDRDAPDLAITSPSNKTTVYEETVVVEGTSQVGAKVRIRNKANGQKRDVTVGNSGTFSASIKLKRGETNEIAATSVDEAGIPRTKTVRVDRLDGRPRVKIKSGPIDRSSGNARIVVDVSDAKDKPLKEAQVDFALGGPGSSVETETLYSDADGRVVWKTTVEPGSPTDDALELAVTVTHPESGETRRVPKTLEFR